MALSDHAIFVNDFSEMSLVVSYLSVKPGCPPEINPRTRSSKQASFDIVSSTPYTRVDIEILRENSNKWTPFGFAESNVFYATGLEPNSVYSLRGKAINGNAVTGWSEVTEIRTLRGKTSYIFVFAKKSVNIFNFLHRKSRNGCFARTRSPRQSSENGTKAWRLRCSLGA